MGTKLSQPENSLKKNLTAIILCAGEGKRIKNFIPDIPKPLIEVKNKPLLLHIISNLKRISLDSILIITGHLGNKIETYISSNKNTHSFLKGVKVLNSGEDYKKGPLYSFLSIFNNKILLRKNDIYLLIPGDTYFNPEIYTEVIKIILNNLNILETNSIIFYQKIEGIKLKATNDSMKLISSLIIEERKSKKLLKEIQQKKLAEIELMEEISQILPIFVLNHKFVAKIINTEKKLSVNTIREIVNYIIQQKNYNFIAIPIQSHYKFYDIDTRSDLLTIREEKEDNRRSDRS